MAELGGACKAGPHLLQTTWASTWLKVTVTLAGCPSTTYTTSGLSSTAGASSMGGPGGIEHRPYAGVTPNPLCPLPLEPSRLPCELHVYG